MLFKSTDKLLLLYKRSIFKFSRTQAQNRDMQIVFPFPYEFTLCPQKFTHYDIRFTEQPINKNLHKNQINHMKYILNVLESILNNKNCDQSSKKQFIHPLLLQKCTQFKNSLKQANFKIQFKIIPETISKSQGYMQIQFDDKQKIKDFVAPKYLHEYVFQRQKQVLKITQIPKKQKKNQQNVLQSDINDILDQKSKKKQIRQAFDEQMKEQVNSQQKVIEKLFKKILSIGTQRIKTNRNQSYLTIDLIKGKFISQTKLHDNSKCTKQVQLYSKWVYFVQKNQPDSIKNSRKRMLFDFQLWNRGTFFPVKNFSDFIL